MERGAWQATVHGVTQSWTRLLSLSMHAHILIHSQSCATVPPPSCIYVLEEMDEVIQLLLTLKVI